MKKIFCLIALFLFFIANSFAQKESKDILSQIKFDSTALLKDFANNACKCIDSINLYTIADSALSNKIISCIDEQVGAYQLSMKLFSSLNTSSKKITINLNDDKNSNDYKHYYYELERRLMDSCNSIKAALKSNNKHSDNAPTSSDLLAIKEYNKGVKILAKENYKEALPFFQKTVELDPEFVFAWDNIGVCQRNLGNLDEALIAYNNSLKLDPKGRTPLQNIPVVYEFKKDFEKALKGYEAMFAVYPDDPESFYGAGRLYFIFKKDNEKALQSMCKAYNLYVSLNSPYRTDAEKMISYIFSEMKKDGKEELFNSILKQNKITPNKN